MESPIEDILFSDLISSFVIFCSKVTNPSTTRGIEKTGKPDA